MKQRSPVVGLLLLVFVVARASSSLVATSRRTAIALAAGLPSAASALTDGQRMQVDAELTTSPLIEELRAKTAANKEKNEAAVRQLTSTMGSVYDPPLKLVRYLGEGDSMPVTRMVTPEQIKELNAQGYELDCPKSGAACGLIRR
mmetsp:Transcript_14095/g.47001  ORF Transcript_14095/g.47001 Transcript_14095/m.47001 type:complete len:145 (+) Transcript_14095:63-497(+)